MSSMLKAYKEFAFKGNLIDMALGIIIGAAFATVVTSVVGDVIMPIISAVFGLPDFSNMHTLLRNPTGETFTTVAAARESGAVVMAYGQFITSLISFILVTLVLFFLIQGVTKAMAKDEEVAEDPGPTAEETLLTEIRDLLKEKGSA